MKDLILETKSLTKLYGNLTEEENLLVHTRLMKIPVERISEVLDAQNIYVNNKKETISNRCL